MSWRATGLVLALGSAVVALVALLYGHEKRSAYVSCELANSRRVIEDGARAALAVCVDGSQDAGMVFAVGLLGTVAGVALVVGAVLTPAGQ